MKVIDLLNKIANNREIPKKIIYKGEEYEYFKRLNGFYNYKNIQTDKYFGEEWFIESILNEEVEITNENKIAKLSYQQIGSYLLERKEYEAFTECVNKQISQIGNKLNNIVEVVNYLVEKVNASEQN